MLACILSKYLEFGGWGGEPLTHLFLKAANQLRMNPLSLGNLQEVGGKRC